VAVQIAAAAALAAVSDHAASVRDRLGQGHFLSTPEKVALNPVQAAVGEVEGVFRVLVGMRFSEDEGVAAAAADALAALTTYNRPNALALMHEVVTRLCRGEGRALSVLDDLVATAGGRCAWLCGGWWLWVDWGVDP